MDEVIVAQLICLIVQSERVYEGKINKTSFLTQCLASLRYSLPRETTGAGSDRDVFNEKPSQEERLAAVTDADAAANAAPKLYEAATIHTSMGDIFVKLFPRECPKTVENFCALARSQYFNGCIFHRVIKQFMLQTG